jgi:hypothetical protein
VSAASSGRKGGVVGWCALVCAGRRCTLIQHQKQACTSASAAAKQRACRRRTPPTCPPLHPHPSSAHPASVDRASAGGLACVHPTHPSCWCLPFHSFVCSCPSVLLLPFPCAFSPVLNDRHKRERASFVGGRESVVHERPCLGAHSVAGRYSRNPSYSPVTVC